MAKHDDTPPAKGGLPLATPGVKWRDLPGTTLALTSLAILGAAAVVSTPFWVLYRRKRKRVDKLISEAGAAASQEDAERADEAPAEDLKDAPQESGTPKAGA